MKLPSFLYAYIHMKIFENYIKTLVFFTHSKLNFIKI